MATKTKETKDKNHTVRVSVEVQHQFELEEYKTKSEQLAQIMADVSLKEEAVKAAAASAKAAIKELESKASDLANQLRLGAEARQVAADCEYDRKKGTKTYRFADGPDKGKVIKKEAMSESEYDMLPLEETPKDKPEEPTPGKPLVGIFSEEAAEEAKAKVVAHDPTTLEPLPEV